MMINSKCKTRSISAAHLAKLLTFRAGRQPWTNYVKKVTRYNVKLTKQLLMIWRLSVTIWIVRKILTNQTHVWLRANQKTFKDEKRLLRINSIVVMKKIIWIINLYLKILIRCVKVWNVLNDQYSKTSLYRLKS